MKSTDFIKVPGLQSTPGAGANLQYWEVFEGRGGDGSGAGATNLLPTLPTLPETPTLPTGDGSWLDTLKRIFSGIGSLSGGLLKILEGTALAEIIDGIISLVAVGAGTAAMAAAVYLLTKLITQFLMDYLDEKTGFEPDLLEQITAIREKMECLCVAANYWTQYDNDKAPSNIAANLYDLRKDLFELRKYLQTGTGDEQLAGEAGALVQAVKDTQYNDEEYHLPGTEVIIKRRGLVMKK